MQLFKHMATIAAAALILAGCSSDALDESAETGWVHNDWDYTDYYYNQGLGYDGVCTHDLSYTEPEIPDGVYYPDGDTSADYYVEITHENGVGYFEYKNPDGSYYGDEGCEFYGKNPFIVYTVHMDDSVVMANKWHERTEADDDEFSQGLWPGEKIVVDGKVTGITVNDDGTVEIQPYSFGSEYNSTDVMLKMLYVETE